jgi:transcriptional regulator with XRE-family HTH domain
MKGSLKNEVVFDNAACGKDARDERRKYYLTLKQVSKRMGINIAYLSYLERGMRKWNISLVQRFNKAMAYYKGKGRK